MFFIKLQMLDSPHMLWQIIPVAKSKLQILVHYQMPATWSSKKKAKDEKKFEVFVI